MVLVEALAAVPVPARAAAGEALEKAAAAAQVAPQARPAAVVRAAVPGAAEPVVVLEAKEAGEVLIMGAGEVLVP